MDRRRSRACWRGRAASDRYGWCRWFSAPCRWGRCSGRASCPSESLNVRMCPVALGDLHKELEPHYSDVGRPSIDPELMIRMLIVGYCYGIRSERKLTQEVELHLAYRWFCKLDLEDKVPHHSTFSENRLGRFRDSDLLRHIFERVVWAAMAMGLVKGEGFAVDASVLEANASRYHGKAPDELDCTDKQRQTRAVAEYLSAHAETA